MKAALKIKIAKLILWVFTILIVSPTVFAEDEMYKARLSVDYTKIMNDKAFLSINAKYKIDKKYQAASELKLTIYEEISDDSLHFIGEIITDHDGNAEFLIVLAKNESDSIIKYEFVVKIEGDSKFKDAKKGIGFMDGTIVAEAIVKDSMNYISATLTNALGEPIVGEKLSIELQRLFAPLTIGESSYKTDDDGNILVLLEDTLPGIDGILTFEVILDSRKYGIVKNIFEAPIGKVIMDLSTFDKRTMWSPPNKTPIFLWIFPNIVIFSIWTIIVILFINIYKIFKS